MLDVTDNIRLNIHIYILPSPNNITIYIIIIMRLITVHLPEAYLDGIDELISADSYPNRSETIRVAVRDLLKTELGTFLRVKKQNKQELDIFA